MITPMPLDPRLPVIATLLDESAIHGLVAGALAAAGSGRWALAGFQPRYIRYKPATSCLVQYEAHFEAMDGERLTLPAQIKVFTDDRGVHRAAGPRLQRLAGKARTGDQRYDGALSAWMPRIAGLLQIYPVDHDLPALATMASREAMTAALRKRLPDYPDLSVSSEPAVLRYKPERKALLVHELSGGPVPRLYGKAHAVAITERLLDQTDALRATGIVTPRVAVAIHRRNFLAHEPAPGTTLAALRSAPDYGSWMEPLVEELARLQAVELSGLPRHRLTDEAAELKRAAGLLGQVVPSLRARIERLAAGIADGLVGCEERFATGHGDFYDDQALVGPRGIAVIDLDEIRRAHPLLDSGNMLAHLSSGAMRGDATSAARDAFLSATVRRTGATERELTVFEAAALLRLAPGPFRRLEPDWPVAVEAIVALAEERLAAGGQTVVPPSRPPDARVTADLALPQLETLTDRGAMTCRFATTLGAPGVGIDAVEVVRHKPGRRAILRYDLSGVLPDGPTSRRLFAKTFASERGARVHGIITKLADAHAFGPDVALPAPVAWLPDIKLLVQRSVAGKPVQTRLLGGDVALTAWIATAVTHLHRSKVDLGRRHDLVRELAPLSGRADDVARHDPELGDRARRTLGRLETLSSGAMAWRFQPVHRDFYHDQILVDGDRLAVLDLDDAALSEPAIDVANFAAHLVLLAGQTAERGAALPLVRRAFLDRCRSLDPDLDPALLRLLEAATLLRLAGIHIGRTDGLTIARSLLDASDRHLDALTREPVGVVIPMGGHGQGVPARMG